MRYVGLRFRELFPDVRRVYTSMYNICLCNVLSGRLQAECSSSCIIFYRVWLYDPRYQDTVVWHMLSRHCLPGDISAACNMQCCYGQPERERK